jgi:SAM-dependent methyltransferase
MVQDRKSLTPRPGQDIEELECGFAPCTAQPLRNPIALPMHDYEATRRSWNVATRNHNTHKGDQAAFLRGGGDVLFPEEIELLEPLAGARLAHLQCNAGQDSLCLVRRGATVTGVDMSDEAIAFARLLSEASAIAATFVRAEVVEWMATTELRFDVAFSSYGAACWLPDLGAWARGVRRILVPGGRFAYVDFHPIVWSLAPDLRIAGDDYFSKEPFVEPVSDYVAHAGAHLGAPEGTPARGNDVAAHAWQHGLGEIVTALADAGMHVDCVREYPHANGCRVHPSLVAADGRRWVWPPGVARVPLMFGVTARVV